MSVYSHCRVLVGMITSTHRYKISLEHGPFEWEVYKTYLDFFALRRVLYPYRARVG